ncbi:hypothetical protein K474DRAFT_1679982 [Panus rudis PR-1116 ss-1]|nr:hypothetical protein K474DRAFT_1679982 [Panus rudis PR-1116 ss-1]
MPVYVSPFFRVFFSLKQPVGSSKENSAALNQINIPLARNNFNFCYPNPPLEQQCVDEILGTLRLATKFEMDGVVATMRTLARLLRRTHSLEAYATLCRFGSEDYASDAVTFSCEKLGTFPVSPAFSYDWSETSTLAARCYADAVVEMLARCFFRLLQSPRTEQTPPLARRPCDPYATGERQRRGRPGCLAGQVGTSVVSQLQP